MAKIRHNKKKTLLPMDDSHFWLQTKNPLKKNTGWHPFE